MVKILETNRLKLRPLGLDDMPALFEIYSDTRAMTFMPTPPHESVDQTHNSFQWSLSRDGAFYWTICLKGDDTPIGVVNYLGETRIQGMGYILHPDYWGQGITTEACRAVLDYGFTNLGYDKVELWIDQNNIASLKVAQKLGFRLRGQLTLKYPHEKSHHISLVWGMRKSEWFTDASISDSLTSQFSAVEPVLHVYNVLKTAEYYRAKLGFHIDFLYGNPPTHGGVSRGEWSGSMVTIQLSQVQSDREIVPTGHLHIRIRNSIDTLVENYRAKGVEIIQEPDNKPWGFREFTIKDLNGHILVFASHV